MCIIKVNEKRTKEGGGRKIHRKLLKKAAGYASWEEKSNIKRGRGKERVGEEENYRASSLSSFSCWKPSGLFLLAVVLFFFTLQHPPLTHTLSFFSTQTPPTLTGGIQELKCAYRCQKIATKDDNMWLLLTGDLLLERLWRRRVQEVWWRFNFPSHLIS